MKEGAIFSLLVASVVVLVIPFSNLVFGENETDWIQNNANDIIKKELIVFFLIICSLTITVLMV